MSLTRPLAWAGLAALLAFLALPVVAVLAAVPPAALLDTLAGGEAADALWVSVRTATLASAVVLLVGTPAAHLLASRRFPGRSAAIALIELPLVLPPAVAGIGLLAAFGTTGLVGGELTALGLAIPFTQAAVVVAMVFVSAPLYVRHAMTAFAAVPAEVVETARSLGAGPWTVARRVVLPLALGGLLGGWALSFARGLGEFGATLIFAGSLRGETRTLPLAVYAELSRDLDAALAIGALLIVVSAAILALVRLVEWALAPPEGPPAGAAAGRRHRPGVLQRRGQIDPGARRQPAGHRRGGAGAGVRRHPGQRERVGHVLVAGGVHPEARREGGQPLPVGHAHSPGPARP